MSKKEIRKRAYNKSHTCMVENCKELKALNTNLCLYHIAKREYMVISKLSDYDQYLKKEKLKFTGRGQRGEIIK